MAKDHQEREKQKLLKLIRIEEVSLNLAKFKNDESIKVFNQECSTSFVNPVFKYVFPIINEITKNLPMKTFDELKDKIDEKLSFLLIEKYEFKFKSLTKRICSDVPGIFKAVDEINKNLYELDNLTDEYKKKFLNKLVNSANFRYEITSVLDAVKNINQPTIKKFIVKEKINELISDTLSNKPNLNFLQKNLKQTMSEVKTILIKNQLVPKSEVDSFLLDRLDTIEIDNLSDSHLDELINLRKEYINNIKRQDKSLER